MLREVYLWGCLVLARISMVEEIVLIHTRRGLGYG